MPPVTPPPVNTPSCGPDAALFPTRVWRLSPAQYLRTIKDTLGVTATLSRKTGDNLVAGFSTNAEANLVTDDFASAAADAAVAVADQVVAALPADLACIRQPSAGDACVNRFVSTYGEKLFRRPLADAEIARFRKFYGTEAAARGATEASSMVLEAMLDSPNFLYRTELGTAGGTGNTVTLTPYELAAQLSYLLTDGPPDEALRADAKSGALSDRKVMVNHAKRLAASEGARGKMRAFFLEYMKLQGFDEAPALKDGKTFPTFAGLQADMLKETELFLDDLLESDSDLRAVFDAKTTFVSKALAKHYGKTDVTTDWSKVTLPERPGLLARASVLSAHSSDFHTSPVRRGVAFYESVLCLHVPPPDPAAATMFERLGNPKDPQATEKQQFDYFTKNELPHCVGCHKVFVPYGLGMEKFDAIGGYRTQQNNRPLDASLTVAGLDPALDGTYPDSFAFASKVMSTPTGQACLVSKFSTYAFGADVGAHGKAECAVKGMAAAFAAGGMTMSALAQAVVASDAFYVRRK